PGGHPVTVRFQALEATPDGVGALAVLVAEGRTEHPAVDWDLAARLGFEAKAGTVQLLAGDGRIVAVAGLGPADGVDPDVVRRAGAVLAKALRKQEAVTVELGDAAGLEPRAAAEALGEGVALASYSYARFKSDPDPAALARVDVVGPDRPAVAAGLARAERLAEAVLWARDLVNAPGGTLVPAELAAAAATMAEREGLEAHILG